MNKERIVNFSGSVVLFFVFLFLFFKFGPKIPLSIITQEKGQPLVVTGEGKAFVTPDIAKINLGIEESGSVLKNVQNSVNKKSENLVNALKDLGVDKKDIRTINYNVYPTYNYESQTPQITGYSVQTSYEITLRDFEKINEALVIATQNGVNITGGINFDINEGTKKEKLQEARSQAVDIAKEKAKDLSKAAGISLGKIINIQESQSGDETPIMYATRDAAGSAPEPQKANIQPGQTELVVTVSLSYEIN